MAQQPNVEISVEERPLPEPEPAASGAWQPNRPGDAVGSQVDRGGAFGHTGPNTGYALKLVRAADWPRDRRVKEVEAVVGAVAGARGSHFGRAPVMGDVRVGLALLGFGADGESVAAARDEILDETAHEHAKGAGFVASVPGEVLFGGEDAAHRYAAERLG